jgi:hypothetical protein
MSTRLALRTLSKQIYPSHPRCSQHTGVPSHNICQINVLPSSRLCAHCGSHTQTCLGLSTAISLNEAQALLPILPPKKASRSHNVSLSITPLTTQPTTSNKALILANQYSRIPHDSYAVCSQVILLRIYCSLVKFRQISH